MIRIPTHRAPTHPGEMLAEEFLIPLKISHQTLGEAICIPTQKINALVSGQADVTPGIALRLSKYFNMSVDFWMNLQLHWDVYHAQQSEAAALAKIRPLRAS